MQFTKRRRWVAASVGIFALSLTQRGFFVNNPHVWNDPAYFLLLMGWAGVPEGIFAWLANPLLLLSWVLAYAGRPRPALISALCAILAAASFLLVRSVPTNESGTVVQVTGYGLGYWLWLLSILAACFAAFFRSNSSRSA